MPPSLPLADDERVIWTGRPRLSTALLSIFVGLVVAVASVGWWAVTAMPARPPLLMAVAGVFLRIMIVSVPVIGLVNTGQREMNWIRDTYETLENTA